MTPLDRYLRWWRVGEALRQRPAGLRRVLDIGCGDGYLLRRLDGAAAQRDGIDPRADAETAPGWRLRKGRFPRDLGARGLTGPYDAIFATAVVEHLDAASLRAAARRMPGLLAPGGRLIITVPHPWVDRILDLLLALGLAHGSAVEEHHGFDPGELPSIFSGLRLRTHRRFQFGLNNVFVFERPR